MSCFVLSHGIFLQLRQIFRVWRCRTWDLWNEVLLRVPSGGYERSGIGFCLACDRSRPCKSGNYVNVEPITPGGSHLLSIFFFMCEIQFGFEQGAKFCSLESLSFVAFFQTSILIGE